ncbi:MAG: tetratricopeptide repeat protein [Aquificae bacterium]|nr:tetratricopeptide repeat protein [Aquificota bacterium]
MMRLAVIFLLLALACTPKQREETRSWRYYYDLGLSAYYAKNYSQAVAHFNRALRVNPKEPRVWNALGLTYLEAKEYEKAEKAFKEALKVDPSFSEARMNLGLLYLRTGKLDEAERYLKQAVSDELFEKKHLAYYHLARVYKAKGKTEEYVSNLEKAVNYNPLFLQAQLELAQAYEELGRYDEAEKVYKSLLRNELGGNLVLFKLARLYYLKGDYEKARDVVKRLLFKEDLTVEERERVKELLTKILIAQQEKLVRLEEPPPPPPSKPEPVKTAPKPAVKKPRFVIQIGAFSSRERAEKLVRELTQKGLTPLRVEPVNGIYKVYYGAFETREEALRERAKLKRHGVYGFIVELK